jgi:hypothetical protein
LPTYRQANTQADALSVWRTYLETLPWQRGSLDSSANLGLLRAASLRIPAQVALDEITRRCVDAGDHPRTAKLAHQLRSAYAHAGHGSSPGGEFSRVVSAQAKWPETDFGAIDEIVRTGFELVDLWEVSPIRFDDGESHVEQIVDVLFPGDLAAGIDPLLCVGWAKGVGFKTKRREQWRGTLHRLEFIVPNPMLSVWARTDDGRISMHSLAATGRRVYQVIEFDFDPAHPVIAALLATGLTLADACAALIWYLADLMPLVCVTSSGGKSLHAWFNVWDRSEVDQRRFMAEAIALGADPKLWCRSQFVRLPDGRRGNGARQTCFFLNPRTAVSL